MCRVRRRNPSPALGPHKYSPGGRRAHTVRDRAALWGRLQIKEACEPDGEWAREGSAGWVLGAAGDQQVDSSAECWETTPVPSEQYGQAR